MNLLTQSTEMIRRHWIILLAGVVILLAIAPLTPAWAGPPNQTVPQPTPTLPPPSPPTATATPAPPPTATPRPDDGGDNSEPAPAQPTPPPASTDLTATVNVRSLNVREGPGVNYAVIGTVARYDVLTVSGRNEQGNWWFICCAPSTGGPGWVSAAFLTPDFTPDQAADLPVTPPLGTPVTPTPIAEPTSVPVTEPITETVAVEPGAEITATEAMTAATGAEVAMTETMTVGASANVTTTEAMTATVLELTITQDPPYAWQGQSVNLIYAVANPGDEDAINVTLRNELPPMLAYAELAVDGEGESTHAVLDNGAEVIEARWAVLAAGEQVTATLTVRIAPDAPNGDVIKNTVAVSADNADSASAGINIGLPPATLPDFK